MLEEVELELFQLKKLLWGAPALMFAEAGVTISAYLVQR